MDAILHKLCEKSEQELWDLLKENTWSKDHAEVAFYMVEIMKGVKKIEHLKKLDEAMEEYDWQEEMKKDGEDKEMSQFARGGRRGGNRGGRSRGGRRGNYAMFGWDEEDEEGMGEYARRRMMGGGNYPEWEKEPPIVYAYTNSNSSGGNSNYASEYAARYFENKYKEVLEDKWEKEKKEKEKEKEREQSTARMIPPPPQK